MKRTSYYWNWWKMRDGGRGGSARRKRKKASTELLFYLTLWLQHAKSQTVWGKVCPSDGSPWDATVQHCSDFADWHSANQFTASIVWKSFCNEAKNICLQKSICLSIFSPLICFLTATHSPSIQTRHLSTFLSQWPQRLSNFLQGILTKRTPRQAGLISRQLYEAVMDIRAHCKLSRIAVSVVLSNKQQSAQFSLWELSSHSHYRVLKPQEWSQQDAQRKLLSTQGIPAKQSQVFSCIIIHNPVSTYTRPKSPTEPDSLLLLDCAVENASEHLHLERAHSAHKPFLHSNLYPFSSSHLSFWCRC